MRRVVAIIFLCLVLIFAFVGCGEIIGRNIVITPFDPEIFIPTFVTVSEQSPGHLALQARATPAFTFEDIVEYYQEALWRIDAQQIELTEHETFWLFIGTYGEDERTLNVIITDEGETVSIFVGFLDEIE